LDARSRSAGRIRSPGRAARLGIYEDGKELFGVGHARNRTTKAVERTVPFQFLCMTITIIWYTAAGELYPEVVDTREEEGGVPSRLIEDRSRRWPAGRHAMVDVRRLPVGEDDEVRVTLDDLAREGAFRMIAAALEAEVDEYVASFVEEVGEDGKRLVVRNGKAKERKLTVGSGTVPIRAPRVNDKRVDEQTGERQRFSSRILPAYARRSPKVTEVLPILYLHGLSTGDFGLSEHNRR
jgi:hypothetical protein